MRKSDAVVLAEVADSEPGQKSDVDRHLAETAVRHWETSAVPEYDLTAAEPKVLPMGR